MAGMIAVAIMVDSSWNLAAQWSHVLAQYISPILSKLIENRSNTMFYLGFLTYATSDTYPNPILAKRYFAHPQHVTKELREDSQRLGIGQTGSGGSNGMAVLEGYVAVLEMFDCFLDAKFPAESGQRSNTPSHAPLTCHLIHVSYASPDESRKPLWNMNDLLDNVTFEALPDEFRKRNINLDIILLRPNARLAELHKQASASPSTNWFPVRTGHSVLLSGFSTSAVTSSIPKSVGETLLSSDLASKAKRAVSVSQNDTPSNEASRGQANISPALRIFQQMRALEAQVKVQMQELQSLQQAGRTQEVEDLKRNIQTKTATFAKLKLILRNVSSTISVPPTSQEASAQTPAISRGNTTQLSVPPIGNEFSTHESSSLEAKNSSITKEQPAPPEAPSSDSLKSTAELSTTGGRLTSTISTEALANQMQKLEQQRAQSTLSRLSPQPVIQVQSRPANRHVWQGTLSWTGPDPVTRIEKEFNAEVTATQTNEDDIQPETWPSVLSLVPSKERSVSVADLRIWIKRYTPKICSIAAQARTTDKDINDFNFKSLNALLLERNLYALASWQLPSGKHDVAVVIFPIPQRNLAAAVFPETGVPELPKSGISNDLQLQNPTMPATAVRNGVPTTLPLGFQSWPLQQRQEFAAKVLAQRHAQLQYLHTQNQSNLGVNTANSTLNLMPSISTPFPSGIINQGASSMVRDFNGQGSNTGFSQSQHVATHATQPGSGGNVSMEMMQSFIQRNPDNTNGS